MTLKEFLLTNGETVIADEKAIIATSKEQIDYDGQQLFKAVLIAHGYKPEKSKPMFVSEIKEKPATSIISIKDVKKVLQ